MSRHDKVKACTVFATEPKMLKVCVVRFPTGAVGVFKLLLREGTAQLLVEDAGTLHGIAETLVDSEESAKVLAVGLLLNAAEGSAQRTNNFGLLMRCELLQEGLIDVDAFKRMAAWIAMRGVIHRAMDSAL
jgi:hypothetical protein